MGTLLTLLLLAFAVPAMAVEQITAVGLFTDKAILRIDGTQRLLEVGQQSPEGVKLIAANSEQATIEFNGKQRQLSLGSHISSQFIAAKKKTVRIRPDVLGMYSVEGQVNGKSQAFLVDTGASTVVLNGNDAKRLGIDYKTQGIKGRGETASGTSVVYLVKVNSVSVGGIKLNNVETAVFDGAYPSKALLGLTFLNRIDMKRDGSLLVLEQ